MNTYYIVFEKFQTHNTTFSWVVRNTPNDLDTYEGLMAEMYKMEDEYKCEIRITNWKKLKKSWLTRLKEWDRI